MLAMDRKRNFTVMQIQRLIRYFTNEKKKDRTIAVVVEVVVKEFVIVSSINIIFTYIFERKNNAYFFLFGVFMILIVTVYGMH